MSDEKEVVTFSQKVDSELKDEINSLIAGYKGEKPGSNAGDFIQLLVDTYKLHKITDKLDSTKDDIKELNQLTDRMYKLFGNMVERSQTNTNFIREQFELSAQQKDEVIARHQVKNKELQESYEALQGAYNELSDKLLAIEEENNDLRENKGTHKELIKSLQAQVEGLKNEQGQHKEAKVNAEKAAVKAQEEAGQFKELLATSQAKNIEAEDKLKAKEKELTEAIAAHEKALKELEDKKDIEREKALLAKEREFVERERASIEENRELYKEIEQLKAKLNAPARGRAKDKKQEQQNKE